MDTTVIATYIIIMGAELVIWDRIARALRASERTRVVGDAVIITLNILAITIHGGIHVQF